MPGGANEFRVETLMEGGTAPGGLRRQVRQSTRDPRPGWREDGPAPWEEAAERTPAFGQVRQLGLIAGIDLIDPATGIAPDWREENGAKICRRARAHGLLTRPIRDTLTLMPPLCVNEDQIREAVRALEVATREG